MQMNRLEATYLKHILIAVEDDDRAAPFRTFVDNWFAYKEGGAWLNGRGRPHWFNNPCPARHRDALCNAHFVSQAAARVLAGLARERLVKDHAIPASVLRDILFAAKPDSLLAVRTLLLEWYRIGVITKAEDDLLAASGFRSSMPRGWEPTRGRYQRYEQAKIIAQQLGFRAQPPLVKTCAILHEPQQESCR